MFDIPKKLGTGCRAIHRARQGAASTLAVRGWPLLVLVSVGSLGVAAQGSPRGGGSDGNRRVPPAELRENILAGLDQLPRPHRVFEQRFTFHEIPTVDVPLGPYRMQLAARLPVVGDGSVGVDLEDAHGVHRLLNLAVTRHVRAILAHAAVPLSPGTVLTPAHVVLDTTWVELPHQWESARAVADDPEGWTVQRDLAAGVLLCAGDLRRPGTPLPSPLTVNAENEAR